MGVLRVHPTADDRKPACRTSLALAHARRDARERRSVMPKERDWEPAFAWEANARRIAQDEPAATTDAEVLAACVPWAKHAETALVYARKRAPRCAQGKHAVPTAAAVPVEIAVQVRLATP